jgi:hypothetical protein
LNNFIIIILENSISITVMPILTYGEFGNSLIVSNKNSIITASQLMVQFTRNSVSTGFILGCNQHSQFSLVSSKITAINFDLDFVISIMSETTKMKETLNDKIDIIKKLKFNIGKNMRQSSYFLILTLN